jgi:hypothetical protein
MMNKQHKHRIADSRFKMPKTDGCWSKVNRDVREKGSRSTAKGLIVCHAPDFPRGDMRTDKKKQKTFFFHFFRISLDLSPLKKTWASSSLQGLRVPTSLYLRYFDLF